MKNLAVWIATGLCAGCANVSADTIKVSGAVLTSGASLAQGRRVPVQQFSHDDYVWMLTDFTWADTSRDGGRHKLIFNWYRNGQLVSHTDYDREHPRPFLFAHTPTTLETHRPAATLGVGHFKVETVVDDAIMASREFDITS